jgi:NifU-like protein involved in Fe-S cluster formation
MTLQGTRLRSDAVLRAPTWTAQEDSTKLEFTKTPEDINGFEGVALEPQRIRTFVLSFNGAEKLGESPKFKQNLIQVLLKQSTKK